ncbi:hypothetical protein [Dyadobacter chenhuakuii]|uniref:DUF1795 domain-containing protein n=1 Tax=Dyadobacter chenhuakuii TaxID=2909339 RepID=A0ABY4XNE1_9BACT|nr:hypothetical protein [Dyadobacter chenhuakuii]MCF2494776.1 hypothetical protein [Dyadobacter chenhuakuii]USJ31903.1 hypothetical protein NFI80_04025 [Dyadobacter chenhuakuii]
MIHRFTILISLFLNICVAYGQVTITNISTPEHIPVAGTKISLIPPKGFEKAANFAGFQQTQSGSSIMVMSIPGHFEKLRAGLTKEAFLTQGVEISEIETLKLNDMPAAFFTGTQNAHGNVYTKFILCFGKDDESVMINGAFPQNLQEVGKGIKQAILGAYFDADRKVDPFEAIDYEISTTGSKLIFAKNVANSLIYTMDGKVPTELADRTSYILTKSFSKMEIEDKKLYCLNRAKQLYPEIRIDSVGQLSVDGIAGYELLGTANNKKFDQEEKVYMAILFSDNLYYIMIGSSNNDMASNMQNFKSITKSFKRK